MEHPWIKANDKVSVIDVETQADIVSNLDQFKRTTTFQSGIISLMANLSSGSEDLEMLKKMFNKLDSDKNGTLTIDEIRRGIDEVS